MKILKVKKNNYIEYIIKFSGEDSLDNQIILLLYNIEKLGVRTNYNFKLNLDYSYLKISNNNLIYLKNAIPFIRKYLFELNFSKCNLNACNIENIVNIIKESKVPYINISQNQFNLDSLLLICNTASRININVKLDGNNYPLPFTVYDNSQEKKLSLIALINFYNISKFNGIKLNKITSIDETKFEELEIDKIGNNQLRSKLLQKNYGSKNIYYIKDLTNNDICGSYKIYSSLIKEIFGQAVTHYLVDVIYNKTMNNTYVPKEKPVILNKNLAQISSKLLDDSFITIFTFLCYNKEYLYQKNCFESYDNQVIEYNCEINSNNISSRFFENFPSFFYSILVSALTGKTDFHLDNILFREETDQFGNNFKQAASIDFDRAFLSYFRNSNEFINTFILSAVHNNKLPISILKTKYFIDALNVLNQIDFIKIRDCLTGAKIKLTQYLLTKGFKNKDIDNILQSCIYEEDGVHNSIEDKIIDNLLQYKIFMNDFFNYMLIIEELSVLNSNNHEKSEQKIILLINNFSNNFILFREENSKCFEQTLIVSTNCTSEDNYTLFNYINLSSKLVDISENPVFSNAGIECVGSSYQNFSFTMNTFDQMIFCNINNNTDLDNIVKINIIERLQSVIRQKILMQYNTNIGELAYKGEGHSLFNNVNCTKSNQIYLS